MFIQETSTQVGSVSLIGDRDSEADLSRRFQVYCYTSGCFLRNVTLLAEREASG